MKDYGDNCTAAAIPKSGLLPPGLDPGVARNDGRNRIDVKTTCSGRSVRRSQLVAELPQQILPPRDVVLALDPLRRKPVDDAQQSSSLVGLGHPASTGFAVAQKIRQTSGTILIALRTLTG